MSLLGHMVGKAANAVAEDEAVKRRQDPTWYWFTRGLLAVTLVAGWIFILVQNKFHVDPPVVVVMLAYLAVVMTVTNLWRVGAAAVATDPGDDTWGKPLGERGELEREKKQLMKSIKEAEFDLAMNKLSKADFEQLNTMYRARAIEVIKALEEIDAGAADTPRQKIEREVAARLLVEQGEKKGKKKAEDKKAEGKKAEKSEKSDDKKADDKKSDDKKAEKKKTVEPTPEAPEADKAKADADTTAELGEKDAAAAAAAAQMVEKASKAKAEESESKTEEASS